MDEKIKSLNENNTWEVNMSENKKLIRNRGVLLLKTKAGNSLDRYKSRH